MEGIAGFRIQRLASCGSTNLEVKRAIEDDAPSGLVIRADSQTGGYGRRGHAWASPRGGLYFSCLLRPPCLLAASPSARRELPTIGLMAGIAVRRGLAGFLEGGQAARIELKWPNDIIVRSPSRVDRAFSKLCGISQEVCGDAICLGIGINVSLAPERAVAGASVRLPEDGSFEGAGVPHGILDASSRPARNAVVCLDELVATEVPIDSDAVFCAVLLELERAYGEWTKGGFALLRDEYHDHMALLGSSIRLVEGESVLGEGVVVGVDEAGALLLRDHETDRVSAFCSGHVLLSDP